METYSLKITDYTIIIAFLLFYLVIGLYYALSGGKQRTIKEWSIGDGEIHWFPVSMSIFASFVSGISMIALPAFVYANGYLYVFTVSSCFVILPLTAWVFVPFYRSLNTISMFTYFEKRFNNKVKIITMVIFIINILTYLGVVVYIPALTLSVITDVSFSQAIIVVGIICSIYTALGGIKAVVLTDTIQALIFIFGIVSLPLIATWEIGFKNVIRINSAAHMFDTYFSFAAYDQNSIFAIFVGGFILYFGLVTSNQVQFQRFVSIHSDRGAKKAVYLSNCLFAVYLILVTYLGLVAYAYFAICDPVETKRITRKDAVIPFLAIQLMGKTTGYIGIFISAIFSGTLSSVSSGVSSISSIIVYNALPNIWNGLSAKSELFKSSLAKILSLVCGILVILNSFVINMYKEQILSICMLQFGLFNSPILGLLTLGMFFPKAGAFSAFGGLLTSLIVNFTILVLKQLLPLNLPKSKYIVNNNCSISNYSEYSSYIDEHISYTFAPSSDSYIYNNIIGMSNYWHNIIGVGLVIIVGYLLSLLESNTSDFQSSKLIFRKKAVIVQSEI